MSEPIAYLNGQYVPASQLLIPVTDLGFMQGVTVAEQLRTFGGRLFQLDKHLDRLARSLEIIGVPSPLARSDFERIALELVERNLPAVSSGGDLGLSLFVTPGSYAQLPGYPYSPQPTVGLHTYELQFPWASKYETGESLVVTGVQQVPSACWPAELKCRSRIHYYLADREARAKQPGARALMVEGEGFVTEASTANLLVYQRGEGLISPPPEKILPGVTVAVLQQLATALGITCSYRDLTVADVAAADEVLLCSTSPVVWSVTQLDGQAIGEGRPGEIVAALQRAFSDLVGLDIVAQAQAWAALQPVRGL